LNEINIVTPFFSAVLYEGFAGTQYSVTTMPAIDGAFAITLAHICLSEFSVETVATNLKPGTPNLPPLSVVGWGPNQISLAYQKKAQQSNIELYSECPVQQL